MTTIHGWQGASRRAMVPVRSLRRLVDDGKLAATKTSDGRWQFDDGDLVTIAIAHGTSTAPTAAIARWLLDAAATGDAAETIDEAPNDASETLEPFGVSSTWLSSFPTHPLNVAELQVAARLEPTVVATDAETTFWRAMYRAARITSLGDMIAIEAMSVMGASPQAAQVAARATAHAVSHLSDEELVQDTTALPVARYCGHAAGAAWTAWEVEYQDQEDNADAGTRRRPARRRSS